VLPTANVTIMPLRCYLVTTRAPALSKKHQVTPSAYDYAHKKSAVPVFRRDGTDLFSVCLCGLLRKQYQG